VTVVVTPGPPAEVPAAPVVEAPEVPKALAAEDAGKAPTAEQQGKTPSAAEQGKAPATTEAPPQETTAKVAAPTSILAIDIGGTKVKILATGQTEPRKAESGKEFTPARLVETVRALADGWEYEAISIGYPGLVGSQGPRSEPGNLGPGWVGFDYAAAFGKPVKMINDAAMQALGSYEGGRMLFLGLGTGLGSTLITGNVIVPMELGRLIFDADRSLGDVLGRHGLEKIGKGEWREAVNRVVTALMHAFLVDYIVLGGGNAKLVKDLPPGVRLGHNLTAFRGGFRLWGVEDVWVLAASGGDPNSSVGNPLDAVRML
jgi:hypothetical protein